MENNLRELIVLKEKKYNYLKKMLRLTKKQDDAIENKNIGKLIKCTERKNELIKKIDQIDYCCSNIEKNLADDNQYKNSAFTIKLKDKDIEILKLLKEIYDNHEINSVRANKYFFEVKQKLGKVRKVKKVKNAYNYKSNDSMYINKLK